MNLRILTTAASPNPFRGIGVQADPPRFAFRNRELLGDSDVDRLIARAEQRLSVLRPGLARLFVFVEQWNPDLDGRNFVWDHPDFLRLCAMIRFLKGLDCRVCLALLSQSDKPMDVQQKIVTAMVAMVERLHKHEGLTNIAWLTFYNEPEQAFPHVSELMLRVFGEKVSARRNTWDDYVAMHRWALQELENCGLASRIRLALPDVVWGAQVRKERMELAVQAFPTEEICFGYHHYNPEDPGFYHDAGPDYAYHGMAEEASRFRELCGARELVIWECNVAGKGFSTHVPGLDPHGRDVQQTEESNAELAYRVVTAVSNGVDGFCLWHMHDTDVNKFGLWRSEEEGATFKPIWPAYLLLCHAFPPGCKTFQTSGGTREIGVAACEESGKITNVVFVNRSGTPRDLCWQEPVCGFWETVRINPQTCPDGTGDLPPAGGMEISATNSPMSLRLEPWEVLWLKRK